MTDRIEYIENRIDLRVGGIAPWPTLSLAIPEGAIDAAMQGIASAVAKVEGMSEADADTLAQILKREFRGQLGELTEIAKEFHSLPASHGGPWHFGRNIPFPDERIEKALNDLAAASGMAPNELEIEALKRGIAAMNAELQAGD